MRLSEICCFVGQVLFSEDGLAILEGLNNDAPVGASLRFVSGASGWVHGHKIAGSISMAIPRKLTQSHSIRGDKILLAAYCSGGAAIMYVLPSFLVVLIMSQQEIELNVV